jgi:phage-related minor tail protein
MPTNLDMRIIAHDHASKVFDRAGKAADKLSDKLKSIGDSEAMQQGAAVGGAAAATGMVAAFGSVMDKGEINAKMAARLDLSSKDSQRYGKISGDVYAAGFGTSMGDVADAMAVMHQQIGAQNDEMTARSTENILNLSQVFDQDLTKSAAAAGAMMKNGLAKDTDEAFDIIVAGMQKGINKSDDLLDTINEYSPQFAKLGLSAQMSMGLLSQGLKGGARDADTVADALKEFSILSINGSKTTAAGFKALGLSGKRMAADIAGGGPKASKALQLTLDRLRLMKDPAKQSAAAVYLFGAKAEDLGKSLYALDPSKAVATLGKVKDSAKDLSKTVGETDKAALTTLIRTLKTNLVDAATPAIKAITALADFFSEHTTTAKVFASAIVGIGVAIGGYLVAVKTIAVATKIWAGVQAVLNFVLSANPLAAIVIGIAALVAGVIWAYKNVGWFRSAMQATGRAGVAVFKKLVEWGKVVGKWFKDAWPGIRSTLIGPIASAILWIVRNWSKVKATFGNFVSYVKQRFYSLKDTSYAIWRAIGNFIFSRVSNLRQSWSSFWGSVGGMARSAVKRIVDTVGGIKKAFLRVVDAVRTIWNNSIGGFRFTAPSWVPGLGGRGIKIPFLAEGGIVSSPTLAMLGEGGEPEMVLPLSKARSQGFSGGNGQTIVINVTQPLGSPEAIAREVTKAFNSSRSRGSRYSLGVL